MKRLVSLFMVVALIVSFSSVGYAQNPPAKLGRGIVNTLTGFWELPIKILKTCKSDGMPVGLTVGMAKGIGWSLYRTAVGLYEIVTFPIPAPAGYEAITDPPTLLTSETLEPDDPSMAINFSPLKKELSGGSGSKRK